MPVQLPTIVVLGAPSITDPISKALARTGSASQIKQVPSTSALLNLTSELPETALAYLFSDTLTLDVPEATLEQIILQIRSSGHAVLIIALSDASKALSQRLGVTPIAPGMDLVGTIARELGIPAAVTTAPARTPAPAPRPPAAPARPASPATLPPSGGIGTSTAVQTSAVWREAREEVQHQGSRELAPLPGSGLAWRGALEDTRRAGSLQYGHQARGYIMVVATRKGGVGKTTMSVNTAAFLGKALAGTNRRVVLVDMNLQQADIGEYLHRSTPTVQDLVKNPALISPEHIESALVHMREENFYALLGPGSIRDANPTEVHVDLYAQVLDALRSRFDYIIIDTPVAEPYHPVLNLVLPMANFIISPISPARVTLNGVAAWLDTITAPVHANGLGVNPRNIGLVLNRAKLNIGLDPREVEDHLARWKFVAMFPDSDAWQRAENEGKLIGINPPADLDEAFRSLLREATGDPALTASAPDSSGKAKKSWIKRLLG